MKQTKLFTAVLFVVMVLGAGNAGAQSSDRKLHSRAQVSFFTPLGTNGRFSSQYTNDFSFNMLVGVSAGEQAFAFAGLSNVIRGDARGFQFGGLFNSVGGQGYGFQFGGLGNAVGRDFEGFQFGGLGNIVGGDFEGFQFGGLGNIVGGDLEGFQFGGLGNIVGGDLDGFQFGGLGNVVGGDVEGFQFGGLGNVVRGDMEGFQFGGLFNVAKRVDGVQFAGLVNIAAHSDLPIGLVNIIGDGEMGIAAGYNEIGTASLTFRSGSRVSYGILGGGYNHKVGAVSVTGGYGAHINILPWLRINNEITGESIDSFKRHGGETFKAGYALMPAFRLGRAELFGGPSVNFMQTNDEDMHTLFPSGSFWKKERRSGRLQQGFIGWQVGLQIIL